ncbi:putative very-long-chain 3-oxoacyl-CoA synthase [Helianthus annuus]|uniref:3-ketoacyl-CoA synthase n=1 Tax=Helianthus annuus TaxID=4232 RepID=A0A251T424_HELAN|nr:3-ketoacyl-CoA synthase 9 [Helianthus annuus]KAF5778462.1 putative very-long-chain 3-oxoacyl-CoA synthase [Helianthus annuus]KAJ0489864.1 putative very-long-chain 3-oxoacyl-CoA synthase [Helianthus annuus]KAJ0493873.1 putative very-long-chain 3-oxoacyl-CoA synthase [Helianthus annuus]KAJ0505775.1 putative very-long-chain 3-oxoacyl-CoA synthase [Helianthus annuus]KAJ0675445.1 putative very-long-chain 3-oxoacyl-CoA synthase [Helianthus annuus]
MATTGLLLIFCFLPFIALTTTQLNLTAIITITCTAVLGFIIHRTTPIYLVDFSCYRPADHLKVTHQKFMDHSKLHGAFNESSLEFQNIILLRSGLGEETYLPPALHAIPAVPSITTAREEAEEVIFGALDNLFHSTALNPQDIGILVVNCSIFNPIPSFSSMIINKYNLPETVKAFNLSGMGCGSGVISVHLAQQMLKVHPNTYAVVVSSENITGNWYTGAKKSMLIPNCLFRTGGAAVLLSNKPGEKHRAKYKLMHLIRTHIGPNQAAYNCAYQQEDDAGNIGVTLSKELMAVAVAALKVNIITLGPLVLPISERVLYLARKLINSDKNKLCLPDFKKAFDHFCIHSGGRAVIEEMEKNLRLKKEDVEPSRMTLHRFGNTSSSSTWYELAYLEAKGRMKKGDRVWQIGFGSGFKLNSAVWEAVRNVNPSDHNPWNDCVDKYPVEIIY